MMNIKKTSRFWQMKNLLLASLSLCVLAVGHPAYASMGMTSESGTAAAADMPAALLTASAPEGRDGSPAILGREHSLSCRCFGKKYTRLCGYWVYS